MKMPAPKGVITVYGNQQEARNIEKGHTPGQTNVYQLRTADDHNQTMSSRTKIATSAVAEHSMQVRGSQRTNG
jgi:hypothetical protein